MTPEEPKTEQAPPGIRPAWATAPRLMKAHIVLARGNRVTVKALCGARSRGWKFLGRKIGGRCEACEAVLTEATEKQRAATISAPVDANGSPVES